MRKTIARHPGALAPGALFGLAGLLSVTALLAACAGEVAGSTTPGAHAPNSTVSASATASASATETTSKTTSGLSCHIAMKPQGVDVVAITLTCAVNGAPTSDTAFSVTYAVRSSTGTHRFTPACVGALSGGRGSCEQRYDTPVPLGLGKGSVAGVAMPDQLILGPVTPLLSPSPSGTPWPGGYPTFTPLA